MANVMSHRPKVTVSRGSSLSRVQSSRPPTMLSMTETKAKRNSIFTFRSKPSTAFPLEPSSSLFPSDSPTIKLSRTLSHSESSIAVRGLDAETGGQKSRGKLFFSRGRKVKRQNSQLRSQSALECVSETHEQGSLFTISSDGSRDGSLNARTPKHVNKREISSPFNFQHLTHTSPQKSSAAKSQVDLVGRPAVSIMQSAGQAMCQLERTNGSPTSLSMAAFGSEKPVKTTSAYPNRVIQENIDTLYAEADALDRVDRTDSPVSGTSLPESSTSPSYQGHSPAISLTSVVTPPRSSSKLAMAHLYGRPICINTETSLVHVADANMDEANPINGMITNLMPLHSDHLEQGALASDIERFVDMTHALTTPDNSARPAISPSCNTPVDDAHAAQGYCYRSSHSETLTSTRASTLSISQTPATPLSFSRDSMTLEPELPGKYQLGCHTLPLNVCDMECLPFDTQQWADSLQNKSSTADSWFALPDIDSSWEEDIDFCYEHAAEADCEFDWSHSSRRGIRPTKEQLGANLMTPRHEERMAGRLASVDITEDRSVNQQNLRPGKISTDAFRPSLLLPDGDYVPDRSSKADPQFEGPDLFLRQFNSSSSNLFRSGLEPLVVPDDDTKLSALGNPPSCAFPFQAEALAEHGYIESQKSEDFLPLYEQQYGDMPSLSSCSRSSGTVLSKSSSFESIPKSFPMPAEQVRGSAGSLGSLPELVHSRQMKEHPLEQVSNGAWTVAPSVRSMSSVALSESDPAPVSTRHSATSLQRKRSASDSAAQALSSLSADTKPHERSSSSSASGSLNKPTYSLFPSSSTSQLAATR